MINSIDPARLPDLDTLKKQIEQYFATHHLDRFDAEDVFDMIEDGEDVTWLVSQQLGENSPLTEELAQLLRQFKQIVHPEEEVFALDSVAGADAPVSAETEAPVADADETASADEAASLEGLDLSQLGLPDGMKLPPGMDMKKLQEMMSGPQGDLMADFSTFCTEKGVTPNPSDKKAMKEVEALQDEWLNTPRDAFEGKTPQQLMDENPEMAMPQKQKTVRRDQPKVGRNDPCPCGSGKKYKKCHGRNA